MLRIVIVFLLSVLTTPVQAEIPLADFFKPTGFKDIVISPDGKRIAGVMEGEGMDLISILDLEQQKTETSFSFDYEHRVLNLQWANNDFVVMEVVKVVGYLDRKGESKGIFIARHDGKRKRYILDRKNSNGSRLISGMPEDKYNILAYTFSFGGLSIKKVHLKNKRQKTLSRPAGSNRGGAMISAIFVNSDYESRLATEIDDDAGQSLYYRPAKNKHWRKANLPYLQHDHYYRYMGHGPDADTIYLASNKDASISALYSFNLKEGDLSLIAPADTSDVGSSIQDADGKLIGYWLEAGYPTVHWLNQKDPTVEKLITVSDSFPGELVEATSWSLDHKKAILKVSSDRNPGDFYLLEMDDMKLTFIASTRTWIKPEQMAKMKAITFKSRDGMDIPGFLTVPVGKEDASNLPMVVLVHGGPHGVSDVWGFRPEVQFLSSRGYAVLQVNFRGSGGYGSDFIQSGYRQWGRKMQDDITDGTQWVVDQGIADPERLCIYGGSYGAYAALMGVVREPDLYKCAIGYVGVYDLALMKTCGDIPRTRSGKKYLSLALGDDKSELRANSSVYNVDKIKADLFIAHGEDDVRVPMCQAKALRKALDKANKPYVWMSRDEGHGYLKMKNRIDFYTRMEQFLAKNIGVAE